MIRTDGPCRTEETRDAGRRKKRSPETLHLLMAVAVWLVTGTTISSLNKWIFAVYNFRYPLLLSALHMLTAIVVDYGLIRYYFVRSKWVRGQELTSSAKCKVFLLSLTFCASIAFGNLGLNYVQLSFAQMIYTTTPIFTLAISSLVLGKQHHVLKYTAMMPICIGASFSIMGEVQFDQTGCLFVVAATMLRGVKSIQQSILLQEEKIDSVLLLYLMAIPSFCILAVAALVLENWAGFQSPLHYDAHLWGFIVLSCLGSVLYNLASCCVISRTSAVTLHILGNLNVVGNLLLSQLLFGSQFSALSCAGAALTLSGMLVYQNSELIASYLDGCRARWARGEASEPDSTSTLEPGLEQEPLLEPYLEQEPNLELYDDLEPWTELCDDLEPSSEPYHSLGTPLEPPEELYKDLKSASKQPPALEQDLEPSLELYDDLEPWSELCDDLEPSSEPYHSLGTPLEPPEELYKDLKLPLKEPPDIEQDLEQSLELNDDLEPSSELYHSIGTPSEPFEVLYKGLKSALKQPPELKDHVGTSSEQYDDLEPSAEQYDDLEPSSELYHSIGTPSEPPEELYKDLKSPPKQPPELNADLKPHPELNCQLGTSSELHDDLEPPVELYKDLQSASKQPPELEQDLEPSLELSDDLEPPQEPSEELNSDLKPHPEHDCQLGTSSELYGDPKSSSESSLKLCHDLEPSLELYNDLEQFPETPPSPDLDPSSEPCSELAEDSGPARFLDQDPDLADDLKHDVEVFTTQSLEPRSEAQTEHPPAPSNTLEPSSELPESSRTDGGERGSSSEPGAESRTEEQNDENSD
ncbi:solute carrier family 35 member E4 isoform X2 [Trichomycterus rosablanca]